MKKEYFKTTVELQKEVATLRKEFMNQWTEELEPREAAKLSADINRLTRIMSSLNDIIKREESTQEKEENGNKGTGQEKEVPKK